MLLNRFSCSCAKALREFRFAQEAQHRGGKQARVRLGHQQSCFAVFDVFGHAATGDGDEGQSPGHRREKGSAKWFSQGGKHECIKGGVHRGHVLNESSKNDSLLQTLVVDQRF